MSVLVEAMCLIVPRVLLDDRYPGGTRGYLAELGRPSTEARYAISDEHLVCASYFHVHAAERAAVPLLDFGFVETDGQSFHDFAIIDQGLGPTRSCMWLMWTRDPARLTSAWYSGAAPGELVTPPDWIPNQSLRLKRSDIREIPGRAIRLAVDDGVETWLDFDTGRLLRKSVRD